ncbi:MAG TPA: hypothetical protein VK620_05440 [Bradyrhizobium sp.]|nr:hypothetical protein [Bradyrhizobium sp.]
MQSTLNPQQADPHADPHDDVLVARIDEELSKLAHDAMRDPLDPQTHTGSDSSAGPAVPPVDTTFRAAAVNNVRVPGHRPSIGLRAVRAFIGFLLAVCIGVAGVVWQAYGDRSKEMIARWTPQLVATSSPPPENPGLPEQPNPPAVQANAAKAVPPQPAPPAQVAPEGAAPAAAAAPESAVLLESMARELASARQEIEQLKASQEQMSRDMAKSSDAKSSSAKSSETKSSQAKAYEARASQTRASQTKASEQNLRPRISAPPPRLDAAPPRRPMPPSYPPPQAAAAPVLPPAPAPYVPRQPEPPPQVTAQPQAEPEFSPPRPPMPVLR